MIQYPKGQMRVPTTQSSTVSYGSRGMFLETLLNQTNDYYRLRKIAVIHKKPTPIQVVKVDYPKRSAAVIKEAYYRHASTTDYNGVYRGCYIDFEAKETKNKTSFPFINIHEHQLQHMEECIFQGGIVFVIFYFSSLNEYYLLESQYLISFIKENKEKKKSIPLDYIKKYGEPIPLTVQSILDYIPVVDKLIDKI